MSAHSENQNWNAIIEVIQHSFKIKKHVDFFRWQQDSLSTIFPHDALIAVWGDFNKGNLNYDVSSTMPGFRTQTFRESPNHINQLMVELYQRWLINGESWYRINNFAVANTLDKFPYLINNNLSLVNSLLVYGIRDVRGNNDCLYIFMNQKNTFPITSSILGILMPHIDTALRRIESLESIDIEDALSDYHVQGLSDREHEIIHWIGLGKTNVEISIILGISSNTVKNHLKRVFSKLDVSSRAQAVATYIAPKLN